MSQALLWFGAAVSLAEILTGTFIAPLGLVKGLTAIVSGHVIGCVILYFAGLIGAKSELPAIESTKISFGKYGAYLFSVINIVQLVGWTGVMIINGAKAFDVVTLSIFRYQNEVLWCFLTALFICIWVVAGFKNLSKINLFAVGSLFIFSIVLGYIVYFSGSSGSVEISDTVSFGAAMELSVVMPLSWLPLIADYTRNVRNKRAGTLYSAGAYFLGSTLMYAIGLGAALYAGTTDISIILLAAGLPAIALIIVLFSTVTTAFLDVYSASVSFSVLKRSNEKVVSILACLMGLAIAIIVPTSRYEGFLYLIGTAFAPLFAITLTDYFILKKTKPLENAINLRNATLWVIGVVLYRVMMNVDTLLGSTLPTMILLSLVCIVTDKIVKRKKNEHV